MKKYRIRKGSIAYHAVKIGDVIFVGLLLAIGTLGPIVYYMQSTHPFL